jgi:hypothetical protein
MCAHRRDEHGRPAAPVLVLAVLMALAANACGDSPHERHDARPPGGGSGRPTARPAAPPQRPADDRVAWTHAAVLRRLEGRRVRVGGQTVRTDAATLTCGGVGVPTTRVHGEPAWIRFRCVQPTFPPGSVAGPDLIFIVEPSRARTLVVSERRLTSY